MSSQNPQTGGGRWEGVRCGSEGQCVEGSGMEGLGLQGSAGELTQSAEQTACLLSAALQIQSFQPDC